MGKDHRRKRIGTALMRKCEEDCRGWGFPNIYLKVEMDNVNAITFYERMGYVKEKDLPEIKQYLYSKKL